MSSVSVVTESVSGRMICVWEISWKRNTNAKYKGALEENVKPIISEFEGQKQAVGLSAESVAFLRFFAGRF